MSTTTLSESMLVPRWPVPAPVHALVTTRAGGASVAPFDSFNLALHVGDDTAAVARNRVRLRERLPAEPVWMNQVHGVSVIDAARSAPNPTADAAVTKLPGVVCAVMTADCLPVLLAADGAAAVGIAHAGWRGMANGVIEATIARMEVDPARVIAYLGPAIGPGAYEVGVDVRDAYCARDGESQLAFRPKSEGKFWCDLYLLARQRLAHAGVTRVYGGTACTFTDSDRYFSFRRDGRTGRMASFIWISA